MEVSDEKVTLTDGNLRRDRPSVSAVGLWAAGKRGNAAPQAEKTFQGQLTKVDAAAKRISVKGTGDTEMSFAYTEQTQVVGPQKDIQGLATQAGAQLRVTYREAGPD